MYSLNVGHFSRLHGESLAQFRDHSGIIVIPKQRYSIGEKVRRLLQLLDSTSAEEMHNRLEFL
jgi:Tfp pilus assembly protein PilZ